MAGLGQDELLAPRFSPVPGLWDREPLHPAIDAVARGSFREREPPKIRGTGYVVGSLEAALRALDRPSTFEEGVLLAVTLGDDADTTGAVFGGLAGAHNGIGGIPARWRAGLAQADLAERFADGLHALSAGLPPAQLCASDDLDRDELGRLLVLIALPRRLAVRRRRAPRRFFKQPAPQPFQPSHARPAIRRSAPPPDILHRLRPPRAPGTHRDSPAPLEPVFPRPSVP